MNEAKSTRAWSTLGLEGTAYALDHGRKAVNNASIVPYTLREEDAHLQLIFLVTLNNMSEVITYTIEPLNGNKLKVEGLSSNISFTTIPALAKEMFEHVPQMNSLFASLNPSRFTLVPATCFPG